MYDKFMLFQAHTHTLLNKWNTAKYLRQPAVIIEPFVGREIGMLYNNPGETLDHATSLLEVA